MGSLVGGLAGSLDAAEIVPSVLESFLLVDGWVANDGRVGTGAGEFVDEVQMI